MTEFKQLDIHWIDLEPAKGCGNQETKTTRDCSRQSCEHSIQNADCSPTATEPQTLAFCCKPGTISQENGLDKNRHINLKQLRAVDVSRIDRKQGELENQYIDAIKGALTIVFNF